MTREKSDVERAKLEMEVESRSLRYKYEQEKEARRVAESLLHQLKEQISRLETKLVKYVLLLCYESSDLYTRFTPCDHTIGACLTSQLASEKHSQEKRKAQQIFVNFEQKLKIAI